METAVTVPRGAARIEAAYREDGERLWRALLAFGGDPELASDALADALAGALRREPAIRDPSAWIWKASFKIAAGELKRRRSATRAVPSGSYLDPEVDLDLADALRRLPERQRVCVVLFYLVGLTSREIGERTGMAHPLVRVNLSRGRKRLREMLGTNRD